jgi:protease-4
MKVNNSLMDLMKAEWALSVEGINIYANVFHKIITGEEVEFEKSTKSILSVFDDNGRPVNPNSNGTIDAPKGSVAIVDMIGPIMKYGDWWSYGGLEIAAALRAADNNPNIIGTVFNVDSPGGSVSAAAPFIEFGKTKKKPVVGLGDQVSSLGYWAMCAVSDHKMADNNISASFGSVGVVLSYIDTRKYLESLGYVFHEVYPEESIHKNEAWNLMLQGKYDLIKKEMLSPFAIKFQDAVRAACPNLKEEIGVLTGKTFGADKALEYGMIDSIGSFDQAINRLHIMSESNHYK